MNGVEAWVFAVVIAGMAALSALTRSFFFLSRREWPLPPALRDALRYGPAAALMAVVAPEVLMPGGLMLQTLADARLWGAVAGATVFLWRRNLLLTIVCGMAVMLPLRLGLGW